MKRRTDESKEGRRDGRREEMYCREEVRREREKGDDGGKNGWRVERMEGE